MREEFKLGHYRAPVARHEAFQILAIPGVLLDAEYAFNGLRIIANRVLRLQPIAGKQNDGEKKRG